MERLIEILEDIQPDVDYANCTDLIDGHYLSSLAIISLIAELEEEYDITIPAVEIVPDNFSRLSPTNFYDINGNELEIHTDLGGTFALVDLNGAVLYKTRIERGITNISVPAKARDKHWIATLNGKMLSR